MWFPPPPASLLTAEERRAREIKEAEGDQRAVLQELRRYEDARLLSVTHVRFSFWQVSHINVAFASQLSVTHHRSTNSSIRCYFVLPWMFCPRKRLPFHVSAFQAKKLAPYDGATCRVTCSRHCRCSNSTINATDLISLTTSLQNPKTIQLQGSSIWWTHESGAYVLNDLVRKSPDTSSTVSESTIIFSLVLMALREASMTSLRLTSDASK